MNGTNRLQWYAIAAALLIATTFCLSFCTHRFNGKDLSTMTESIPKLKSMFERSSPVCFGRLLIDVPGDATVVWGEAQVPYDFRSFPGRASEAQRATAKREQELKVEDRYPTGSNLKLYMETIQGKLPSHQMIVSQKTFSSEGILRIESFFTIGNDLYQLDTRPLAENKDRDLNGMSAFAARARARRAEEVPTEDGLCLEGVFLPDSSGEKPAVEHVRIGIRLKEFPDVHLSIYTAPPRVYEETQTIKYQMDRASRDPAYILNVRELRRQHRELKTWPEAWEILARSPGERGASSYHDFLMESQGIVGNPYHPRLDSACRAASAETLPVG